MEIRIKETGKLGELHIYDCHHIDWAQDCIGNNGGLHYDRESGEYTMTQEEYDWWADYLKTAQADYDEGQALRAEYGDDVAAIIAEELQDEHDLDCEHDDYQRAFERIREELGPQGAKKAIGTIKGQDGKQMVVYYNGAYAPMTAEEEGGCSEEVGYTPKSLQDAKEAAEAMWEAAEWEYKPIE